jgi:cell division protein FtsW
MEAEGYHVIQSWVAMHSGGFWGQGLGNSVAKLDFLPEPWTDFIAAVIAEELGLVAMLGLIGLYALFLWRGLYIARHARDSFSMLLASTLTLMVALEAFFNLGVIMGLLPPKGLVLPFISYGATAMMSHLWVVGILLSISAESHAAPMSAGWPLATDDDRKLRGAA